MNNVIQNRARKITYAECFIVNDKDKHKMAFVANSFNEFFFVLVNVGPDLTGKIPDPGTSEENLEENNKDKSPCYAPHSSRWTRNHWYCYEM